MTSTPEVKIYQVEEEEEEQYDDDICKNNKDMMADDWFFAFISDFNHSYKL